MIFDIMEYISIEVKNNLACWFIKVFSQTLQDFCRNEICCFFLYFHWRVFNHKFNIFRDAQQSDSLTNIGSSGVIVISTYIPHCWKSSLPRVASRSGPQLVSWIVDKKSGLVSLCVTTVAELSLFYNSHIKIATAQTYTNTFFLLKSYLPIILLACNYVPAKWPS